MFYRKVILKRLTEFTRKRQRWSDVFNKVNKGAGLQVCNFEKNTVAEVFSCKFGEIFTNTFVRGLQLY